MLAVILILCYRDDNPYVTGIRSSLIELTAPALEKVSDVIFTSNKLLNNFSDFFDTYNENKKLKERNDFLEYYFYRYKQVAEENNELRAELNATKELIYPFITAQVIARNSNNFHQEIIINAGSKNGIKKGQMVLSHNNLVGRVIEVSFSTSHILVISDYDSRIPVTGLNSKIHFIASGLNSKLLNADYLGDAKLIENEIIVTNHDSPLIIPNILVGIAILKDGNYFIKPNIDINQLEFVQILQQNYE